MQEEEIIFGGEKKLKKAIEEAVELFHPKAIGIFATCPVGLIGDDIHSAAREMEEKYPDINIFAFSCEGYKGVSQSAGHHIANNKVFSDVVGQKESAQGRGIPVQHPRRVQYRRRCLRDRAHHRRLRHDAPLDLQR